MRVLRGIRAMSVSAYPRLVPDRATERVGETQRLCFWFATLTFCALATSTLPAQWLNHPAPGIPRHPDGKPNLSAPAPRTADGRPDLSGIWAVRMRRSTGATTASSGACSSTWRRT